MSQAVWKISHMPGRCKYNVSIRRIVYLGNKLYLQPDKDWQYLEEEDINAWTSWSTIIYVGNNSNSIKKPTQIRVMWSAMHTRVWGTFPMQWRHIVGFPTTRTRYSGHMNRDVRARTATVRARTKIATMESGPTCVGLVSSWMGASVTVGQH